MNDIDSKITLKVNGSEIPMNAFVSRLLINTINGMVDSLDKIPDDKKKIEITIQ